MHIEIRYETSADVAAIEAVTIAAFLTAAHSGGNEQFIVRALREAGALAVSLVAVADGSVIGHVGALACTVAVRTLGTNAARSLAVSITCACKVKWSQVP